MLQQVEEVRATSADNGKTGVCRDKEGTRKKQKKIVLPKNRIPKTYLLQDCPGRQR
jgi:hypothetical protein